MILKTALPLIALFSIAHGLDGIPTNILDLKDIVIDGYHGSMHFHTLELFENVEFLGVMNCNFSMFNENSILPLKNIQKIVLAYNHFDIVRSDNMTKCCQKLRELEMYACSMGTLNKEHLQKAAFMPVLEKFLINKMDIPVLQANSLAGSNLKSLAIEYSNLATIEDGALNGMEKLEILNLKNNKIKTVPSASLAAAKTLKKLDLCGNLLEKITAADFPLMPNLKKLNLGYNPIKQIDLKGLKDKLPKIKEIDVSDVDIEFSQAEGLPLIKRQIEERSKSRCEQYNHFEKVKVDMSECCQKLRELEMYECTMGTSGKVELQKAAVIPVLEKFLLHRMNIPVLYENPLAGSSITSLTIEYSNLSAIEDGALNGEFFPWVEHYGFAELQNAFKGLTFMIFLRKFSMCLVSFIRMTSEVKMNY